MIRNQPEIYRNEDAADQEIRSFFYRNQRSLPLYQAFEEKLFERFPKSLRRVQKTQISFYNRHLFACASLTRVRKKSEMPDPYLVITLGLSYPLDSQRVVVKCEPYPGRWTTHIVISAVEEIDEELLGWLQEAYEFAERK
ncbi:MAG: DUF5655 domain-containing protein [Erysipelotrichaceae bacterium]|nr:DUF5655 domain-containing protein [Erysipelotrichaceae bacterium]